MVKIYELETPQEHLEPSDSNSLFLLQEFSLDPTAMKGSALNKDWRLGLCFHAGIVCSSAQKCSCTAQPTKAVLCDLGTAGTQLGCAEPRESRTPQCCRGTHSAELLREDQSEHSHLHNSPCPTGSVPEERTHCSPEPERSNSPCCTKPTPRVPVQTS